MKIMKALGIVACVLVGGFCCMLALAFYFSANSDEIIAKRNAKADAKAKQQELDSLKEQHRKALGKHCVSVFDGSQFEFKRYIQQRTRNPKSFEHIKTTLGSQREDGTHLMSMTYRAQNGFGGMTLGTAKAILRNEDCQVTVTQLK